LTAKICSVCEAENDENNRFCHACGTKFAVDGEPVSAAAPPVEALAPPVETRAQTVETVELQITERVIERLMKWARVSFTLFVVPVVAVVVFLGFKTFADFTDLGGKVQAVSTNIQSESGKLSGKFKEISDKLAEIQKSINKFNVTDERISGMMDALAHVEAKVMEYYANTVSPREVEFIAAYFQKYLEQFASMRIVGRLANPPIEVSENPWVGPDGGSTLIVYYNPAERHIEIGRLAIQRKDRALLDFAKAVLQIGITSTTSGGLQGSLIRLTSIPHDKKNHIAYLGSGLARYLASSFKGNPVLALDKGVSLDLAKPVDLTARGPDETPRFAADWAHRFWTLSKATNAPIFNRIVLQSWVGLVDETAETAGKAFLAGIFKAAASHPKIRAAAANWVADQ
jgi:hypothetical protein